VLFYLSLKEDGEQLLGWIGAILILLLSLWLGKKVVRHYRLKRLHERVQREWFHTAVTWFD
jgi:hypothetical protein